MKNKTHIIDNTSTTISKKTTAKKYVVQKTHLKGSPLAEMSKEIAAFFLPCSSFFSFSILFPLSQFLSSSSSPCSSHQQHGLLNYRPAGARPMPREGAPPLSKKCNKKMKENPSQFSLGPSPQQGSTINYVYYLYNNYIYIYIYIYLNFKLFLKIIKFINKFNTKSHLILNSFCLIKK